jgi:hypothetical protein
MSLRPASSGSPFGAIRETDRVEQQSARELRREGEIAELLLDGPALFVERRPMRGHLALRAQGSICEDLIEGVRAQEPLGVALEGCLVSRLQGGPGARRTRLRA